MDPLVDTHETDAPTTEARSPEGTRPGSRSTTTCAIMGGGPAGAVLGLLLARKGVDVLGLPARVIA